MMSENGYAFPHAGYGQWNKNPKTVTCPVCGAQFKQNSRSHRYCSKQCSAKAERERRSRKELKSDA